MYYVGCDQHKKYSFVVAKDQDGNTMNQQKLYHSDKESMKQFFGSLPKNSVVALESCGFDHWLGDMLEDMNLQIKLSHTVRTKAIAEERIKTDKVSANVLADLLRVNLLPEAYRAPQAIRDARALLRYRMRLVNVRSGFKNKIHSIINFQGIQHSFSDIFGKEGRRFLSQLSLREPYPSIIANYLSVMDHLHRLILQVDRQLRQRLKQDKTAQLLTTIPGIGRILAHVIAAEIGDIHRFKSSGKLARYVGIVPRLHQSGQVCYYGHITKQGNKYLRTAYVEAAQTAIRRDPYLRCHHEKIKAKKGYGVAIVAIAHKLVKSTYKILTCDVPYKYRSVLNG